MYHSESLAVSLFKTDAEHQHDGISNSRGLNSDLKEFIENKFRDGIEKPNAILALIKKANLEEPPKSKIIHHLRTLREEKYGKSSITDVEIKKWAEIKKIIPIEEDTPFVINYKVNCDSLNENDQKLKILISSKRLLNNLNVYQMVQIDATYKLIWQGYPVFVIGITDKNQVFHLFGLGVQW